MPRVSWLPAQRQIATLHEDAGRRSASRIPSTKGAEMRCIRPNLESKHIRRRSIGRVLAGLAVAMTVSTGLSVGVVSTAQAAPEKYFELRSQGSDNCLSVDGRGPGGPGADLADV